MSCDDDDGVNVDVGSEELKLFVDVQTLALFCIALNVVPPDAVYDASAYAFVINWVDVDGVSVDVGSEELKLFVDVQTLALLCIALNVVFPDRVVLMVLSWVCPEEVKSKYEALDKVFCLVAILE